ncbi:MAG: hypothetical protein ACMXYM_00720 [Candidatus Woesearchaeota archaeon]
MIRIYEANVTPGALVNFTSMRSVADSHQGFLSYDSNKGFFNGPLTSVKDGTDTYDVYLKSSSLLNSGAYSFILFNKYARHESGDPDDRLVNITIGRNDYLYRAPFPDGIEGLVRHHQAVPHDGYYTVSITSEDPVYYYPFSCPEPGPCADNRYCTQTQTFWGDTELLGDAWLQAVGGELVIGTGYTMTFTGPYHVEQYLPNGGPATVLEDNHTNPLLAGGVLGGQLTALQLNILFSEAGIGLTGESSYITDHIITRGAFEGMSVGEFRDLAFEVFGGEDIPVGKTLSDFVGTADSINNNHKDCRVGEGYLAPYCAQIQRTTICTDSDGTWISSEYGWTFTPLLENFSTSELEEVLDHDNRTNVRDWYYYSPKLPKTGAVGLSCMSAT